MEEVIAALLGAVVGGGIATFSGRRQADAADIRQRRAELLIEHVSPTVRHVVELEIACERGRAIPREDLADLQERIFAIGVRAAVISEWDNDAVGRVHQSLLDYRDFLDEDEPTFAPEVAQRIVEVAGEQLDEYWAAASGSLLRRGGRFGRA